VRFPRIRFRLRWERPETADGFESEARIVSTRIEHDLSELDISPAVIEPSAYVRALANDNAGLFIAYLRVGFDREEAFALLQQQLDGVMHRGHG
jgi:hypothetical protein